MATLKQEEESISEIQNYLDTFNKEIEDPNQIPAGQLANKESVVVNEGDNSETNEDGGTYFVDQSGQYYYQSNDVDVGDGTATLVTPDGGHMVSIPNSTNSNEEGVVLTQGEGGYQTVTILPPESSSGEVSYVLIVQQPDGGEQAVISSEVLNGTDDVLQSAMFQ